MFLGYFEHTIDDKNRLSIPAPFRQLIQEKGNGSLAITQSARRSNRCLEAYPLTEWLSFVEEVIKLPKFDPRAKNVRAHIFGSAFECSVDKQGRILIAPRLREYADLKKDVVFSGDVGRFYIWNKEAWLSFKKGMDEEVNNDPSYLYFPS